jgi:L-ascorbate metabolism protein UlaG (beta-lactamase superfamily)
LSWRSITDLAKQSPLALRTADFLGRGRGRLRVLDHLGPPAPCAIKPDLAGWESHDLAACWIGHATVLLRIEGRTILTDPVFSNRIGLGLGVITGGPRRLVAPALAIRQLPPLDLILISHAHFDHLDRPTLMRLSQSVPIITAPRTQDLIRDLGFGAITELRWGEHRQLGPLRITAQKVNHWGARTFFDLHRGFNGYLIESARCKILYGGDTAYQTDFRALPPVDLAILGIGAYDPYIAAHATPEQAWELANHARAERLLAMHHSAFRLSHEPVTEPIERLLTVAGRSVDRLIAREMGRVWRGG